MTKLSKILNIIEYILLAVTLVLAGLFYFGGEVEGAVYSTPIYTDNFLNWGKILVVATALIAIISEIVTLVLNPKNAVRTLVSIVALGVIVLVAYSLGDGTPMNLVGYKGGDNVPSMLVMSDTFLFSTYFLFGIAIVAILYTELSRLFR
jgi:hypothetical protein